MLSNSYIAKWNLGRICRLPGPNPRQFLFICFVVTSCVGASLLAALAQLRQNSTHGMTVGRLGSCWRDTAIVIWGRSSEILGGVFNRRRRLSYTHVVGMVYQSGDTLDWCVRDRSPA